MNRLVSLAHLTALPCDPPALVQIAADAGCGAAGIRLWPAMPGGVHYALMDDAALLRETLARMDATGVTVLDIELLRIGAAFDVAACTPFLEVGAQLRAKHILVAGDDPDEARTAASFAALCEAAARYGLTCNLEFMPWTAVRDAPSARRIVAAAAQPNGGVLVDALHWSRSGSTLDDVSALPRDALNYAQICDGLVPGPSTVEGLIFDARCERLLPGEGGIALRALFERLPAELPVSIEIPNDRRAPAVGYGAWVKAAIAATTRLLAGPG